MGGTPLNTPDPMKLMQALLAMRQGQGIPGITPQGVAPIQQVKPQASPQPQAGGMPGAVNAPQGQGATPPTPSGAARQLSPASPTPFNGTFGDRRGIISQLVNSAEKRTHDKKVNEASMYYNQINSFLASNDPKDQAKAQQLLDDPKVRKILKTGLDYVPLEEDVPPEAIGVHQAQQKIDQKQSALKQIQQMLTGGRQQGNAQPRPQGRAVIPQASQEAQQKYQLGEAKTGTELAHAKEYEASGEAKTATAIAEQQKADAETAKAESQRIKDEADATQAKAYADNARSQAKLYEAQAKDYGDLNPSKKREAEAHSYEMNALGRYHDAMAKYVKNGKLPGGKVQDLMKSQRADAIVMLRGFIADNTSAQKDVRKDTGYILGPKTGLLKAQDDSAKKAKDMRAAIAWYDSEGTKAVNDGKMTPPEAAAQMYRMAGIEAPTSGISGEAPTSTDDEIMKLIGQ